VLANLRSRLTYANVVATLALFVALGGGSYAAVSLKRNQVKSRHIAKNAVTAPKVKDESLLAQDFAPGQLPQGERGLQGEQGPQGPSAASSFSGGGFSLDGSPERQEYCGPTDVRANNSCTSDEATQLIHRSAIPPNATIVARDLFVKQSGPNYFGSRTYTLRVEGTDTAVSCTIAGDTAQTCNSGGATATIPPGSRILLHVHTVNANVVGFWFGWRATTP
jgi:hypothetical protein